MGKRKNMMKQHERRQRLKEAREEATELVLNTWDDFCRRADITILYTLHTEFKFGKERCERFYRKLIQNQLSMIEQFRCGDDDSHYLVMEKRLKDAGIDVKALQAEADRLPIDQGEAYKRRSDEIKAFEQAKGATNE